MKKYDPKTKCVKCGSGHAAVRFVATVLEDGMKHVCCTCGHYWFEVPLDEDGESEARRIQRAIQSGKGQP